MAFLVSKQPENISQLTKLLRRHYSHVWNDCQILASLGIIELKKTDFENKNKREEVKPIALYEEIVFNFPVKEVVDLYSKQFAERI